nr:DUF2059 domain-containing protein [Sphingomicrobium sediminis]
MADSEPRLREVMAELFADRFTESELLELAAFSQTETGMKLTRTFWTMSLEPSYYRAIIAAMPGFIRGMPRLVEAMETRFAEADLPPMFPEPEPFDEIACSEVEEGDEVDACYDDSWEVAEEAMEAEAVEIETATEEIQMSDEDLAAMYEEWAADAEAEAADYRARAEELRAGSED